MKESLGPWLVPVGGAFAAIAVPSWYLSPPAPPVLSGIEQPAFVDVRIANPPPIDAAIQGLPFSTARAPDMAPLAAKAADAGAPASPAASAVPKVVGVAGQMRGRALALVVGNDGVTKLVTAGETVDGWKVALIGQNGVTFISGEAKQMIGLDYSNNGGAPGQEPGR